MLSKQRIPETLDRTDPEKSTTIFTNASQVLEEKRIFVVHSGTCNNK